MLERLKQRNENEKAMLYKLIENEDDDKMASMKAPARCIEASQPNNETEQTLPYNPPIFSTTSNNPVKPSNNAAMLEEGGHISTPFIIPRQDNPPAYPAEEYNITYPTQPTATPSNHASLPYAISPYPHTNQTETPSSTEFALSGPPFIKPF